MGARRIPMHVLWGIMNLKRPTLGSSFHESPQSVEGIPWVGIVSPLREAVKIKNFRVPAALRIL